MKPEKFYRIVNCFNNVHTIDNAVVKYKNGTITLGDLSADIGDEDAIVYAAVKASYKNDYRMQKCFEYPIPEFLWSLVSSRYGIDTAACYNTDSSEIKIYASITEDEVRLLRVVENGKLLAAWMFTDLASWYMYCTKQSDRLLSNIYWLEEILYKAEAYDYRTLYKTCFEYVSIVGKVKYYSERESKKVSWRIRNDWLSSDYYDALFDIEKPNQICRLTVIELFHYVCTKCNTAWLYQVSKLVKKYSSIDSQYQISTVSEFTSWLLALTNDTKVFEIMVQEINNALNMCI